MEKIAILTDSSSSIYNVKHNFDNLFMIDLPVYLGDVVFTDFANNKDEDFYDVLKNSDIVPKTSQPSIGETIAMYDQIKALGYTHIIYLPISKELSGTYQNGYLAKDMVEDITVEIVDTKTSVAVLGSMALEAARLVRDGLSVEAIVAKMYEMREKTYFYVTVNDLTSLVKNGRLSNAKSFVANLLKIKPVIVLTKEGRLESLESVRTYKGAIKSMIERVSEFVEEDKGVIQILYTNNENDLRFVEKLITERFPNTKIEVYTLPATVIAHLGLDAIAVGYVRY